MRGIIIFMAVFALISCAAAAEADDPINAYLHSVDGQRILHVWGTHYEMGYAQGQVLGSEIIAMMHGYILKLLPPKLYEALHVVGPLLFGMPDNYWEEAQGVIDGMKDSGAQTFIAPLGRHIDATDLLLCNAVADIGAMGCSTQLAWGAATAGDPRLLGESAIVRNLDWTLAGPEPFLLSEASIVIVYSPTSPRGRTVALVTFPGYFGCLSCMNDQGTSVAVNIGHNGIPLWENDFAHGYTPIGLSIRQALHDGDANSDGVENLDDVIDFVSRVKRSGAIVLNLAMPYLSGEGDAPVILEVDNQGEALRTPADEPEIPEEVLISTNELRKLGESKGCYRYDILREEIIGCGGQMTLDNMWDLEGLVTQDYFLSTTVQTMYLIPFEREIGVSYSTTEAYSTEIEPAVLTWDELSALPEGVTLDEDDAGPDPETFPEYEAPNDTDDSEGVCGLW